VLAIAFKIGDLPPSHASFAASMAFFTEVGFPAILAGIGIYKGEHTRPVARDEAGQQQRAFVGGKEH